MSDNCILVVEDDNELREAVCDTLLLAGFKVKSACSAEIALRTLERCEIDMVVSDVNMEGMDGIELLQRIRQTNAGLPVLIVTAFADVSKAVSAIKLGAVDFMMKPFEPRLLIETIKQQIGMESDIKPIVVDQVSRKFYMLAQKVAKADSTVLILGESGVGKEVVSKFIHEESSRKDKVMVAINCAAIPDNMLEATLFGHEKGAYTGAHTSRPGKFEQADGGTLLLDEISEMDLGLQAKLLRVLQEKEVERLGGKSVRKVDVRVIATSNRNLVEYVKAGKFREDLYYRVSVFPLHMAPLRGRTGDILPLAEHLLEKYARRMNRTGVELDQSASEALCAYSWPGNVRELENVMQRALILQSGSLIGAEDIFIDDASSPEFGDYTATALVDRGATELFDSSSATSDFYPSNGKLSSESSESNSSSLVAETNVEKIDDNASNLEDNLKNKEFEIILDVLRKQRGSRSKTAEQLGISARTLRYKLAKMRDCGIDIHAQLLIA
ncbi:MAG: two-component system response regulator FlrC [Candidatus Azotimanducaceae bacterium]|jgi:two-component system response regulator FlrC